MCPLASSAQVKSIPPPPSMAEPPNPSTSPGACPDPLAPQHSTLPPDPTAHACSLPAAATSTTPNTPGTHSGTKLPTSESLPNSPAEPLPQHSTLPSASAAQLYARPDVIETAFVIPLTGTGVELLVVVPSPNCPSSLLPQHSTLPS